MTDVDKTTYNETETSFTTALTSTSANTKSALPKAAPKKKGKPKLTTKEKKERMVRDPLFHVHGWNTIDSDTRTDGHREDYHVSSARVPRRRRCACPVMPSFYEIDEGTLHRVYADIRKWSSNS